MRDIGQESGGASASGLNIGCDSIYFGLCPAVNKNVEPALSSAASVTVNPGQATSLEIRGLPAFLPPLADMAFEVVARDADGNQPEQNDFRLTLGFAIDL